MKFKSTCVALLVALLFMSPSLYAQPNVGDYQSVSTGLWATTSNWERWDGESWITPSPAPTSADGVITILATHVITVGTATNADQLVVDGTLQVNSTFTINDGTDTDLSVNGLLVLQGTLTAGTGTPAGTLSGSMNWTGGTLALPLTVAVGGTLDINTNNKTLATTLTNNGTITWSASTIAFNNGTLTNNATFSATGATAFNTTAGTNLFNNSATGTFTKSASALNIAFNIPVDNAGTIDIEAGGVTSATANGAFTNSGSINVDAGTTLTLSGTLAGGNNFNAGTVLSGTGTITSNSNTNVNLTLAIPAGLTFVASGTQILAGSGNLSVTGILQLGTGTVSVPVTINAAGNLNFVTGLRNFTNANLTNNGTVTWTAGSINLNTAVITNNGLFTVAGTGDLTIATSTINAFDNEGQFVKTSATTTNITSVPFTNAGTIQIDAGILNKNGINTVGFTNSGTFNIASGASFTYSVGGVSGLLVLNTGTVLTGAGTFRTISTTQINLALTVPSTLLFEVGIGVTVQTVSGTGSLTIGGIMNWGGGTFAIPLTIATGATLNSSAGKNLNSTLTINGTVNLTDPTNGSIALLNATITNNGTINDNFLADRAFTNSGGTNIITNNGTYYKANAGTTTTFNSLIAVTNSASGVFSGQGTITFAGTISNAGIIAPGEGTTPALLNTTLNAVNNQATTLRFRIKDAGGEGVGHDKLNLTGSVNINSASLVIVDFPPAPFPASYTIIEVPGGSTITGEFAGISMPPQYTITYNPTTVVVNKIASTLPVVWGIFNAEVNNTRVDLKWSTLQEENTSHFLVQHSVDGANYSTIATLPAQGFSGSEVFYKATHNSPDLKRTNFYRISQVDIDGKSKYSVVRPVRFEGGKAVAVIATPNPVVTKMQLFIQADNLKLVLSGPTGTILNIYQFQKGTHQVSLEHLPAGNYHLGVYDKKERIDVLKIIKL
ncbi:MAG: hypothetical protein ABWZ25_03660 [Chitinophagaceae bacterium]